MKIAEIVVRSLVGALLVFSALAWFFNLFPEPELTGDMKVFNDGLKAAGYFLPLLKITELVCGLALLAGFWVPLALVVLAPVVLNIFLVHIFLEPSGMPVGFFLLFASFFLAYRNWEKFKTLLERK